MDPLDEGEPLTIRQGVRAGRPIRKTRVLPPPGGDVSQAARAERLRDQGGLNWIEITADDDAPGCYLVSSQWRYEDTGLPVDFYVLYPTRQTRRTHVLGGYRCTCPSAYLRCAHTEAFAAWQEEQAAARLPVYRQISPEGLLARLAAVYGRDVQAAGDEARHLLWG